MFTVCHCGRNVDLEVETPSVRLQEEGWLLVDKTVNQSVVKTNRGHSTRPPKPTSITAARARTSGYLAKQLKVLHEDFAISERYVKRIQLLQNKRKDYRNCSALRCVSWYRVKPYANSTHSAALLRKLALLVSMVLCSRVFLTGQRSYTQWRSLTAEPLRYGTRCRGISQFYLHAYAFVHERNEPYPP